MIATQRPNLCILLAVLTLTGCASINNHQSDEEVRTQLNDAARIASYFDRINPPAAKTVRSERSEKLIVVQSPVRTNLEYVLNNYVPKDFMIVPDRDVELKTELIYDPSQPWMDALSKSMASVGVEMTVSPQQKKLYLNSIRTALSDVIEKHVPDGFRVYSDADVDVSAPIRYDGSRYWLEALTKGAAAAGVDVTANMSRKIVLLKTSAGVGATGKSKGVAQAPAVVTPAAGPTAALN